MKVSIIGGGGRVGSDAAYALQLGGIINEIALVDVNQELAAGEALDLRHGASLIANQTFTSGSYEACAGSDCVVITAGLRRKPDESRLDLINRNVGLFKGILDELKKVKLAAGATILVVSNPVDILTHMTVVDGTWEASKVLGLGTVLDTSRFRSLLADHFKVGAADVKAVILGEHGDSMVPIWSTACVDGVPLTSLPKYDPALVMKIFERARKSGAEVIALKGGAGYAVGVAILEVLKALTGDSKAILPVSTWQSGLYGIKDVCLSVPTRLGKGGVEQCLEMELWPKELAGLQASAAALKETLSKVALPS